MCGIWASFGFKDERSVFFNALKIAHRGPDFFRVEAVPHFNHCYMAFHHLSIMDDLKEQQPLRLYNLPYLRLMYNGEIYNYEELSRKYGFKCTTRLDGEVILHLYHKFGAKKAFEQLDGVFAACIVDTQTKTLHFGRDTFGVKPLFTLREDSGELGISSEAKGLIDIANNQSLSKKVMPFTPGTYASYTLSQETGFTKLTIEEPFNDVVEQPKFDVNIELTSDINTNIRNIFTEAVRKRIMTERRVGCLLSGGLDSSLVTAVLVRLCKEMGVDYSIQTFSIGFNDGTDLKYARKVAELLQTEHHEVIITLSEAFDAIKDVIYAMESYDISMVQSSVLMYLLAKYIKENTDTTVVLSGDGSDELTQGYLRFHKAPDAQQSYEESVKMLRELYLFDVLRADRTTSAHGLELRVPFLDKFFTSYYLSFDKTLVQPTKGIEKYLLRSAFEEHLNGYLPYEILWRKKEGLSDGVSKGWGDALKKLAATKCSLDELSRADLDYPVNTPKTLEQLMYRKIFNELFPRHDHLCPHPWKFNWVQKSNDP